MKPLMIACAAAALTIGLSGGAGAQAWRECVPNSIGPGGCDSIGPGGGKSIGPGGGLSIGPGGGKSIGPGGGQSIGPGGGRSIGPGGGMSMGRDWSRGLHPDTLRPAPQGVDVFGRHKPQPRSVFDNTTEQEDVASPFRF